jgi:hypothetical protein
MWVPSHMGITGNEASKDALDQNVETTIKVVKSDYCKWVKEKSRQRWQNEWGSSTSSMVTVKPHVNRYKEGLPRRQQVAVSRLRMGYTNMGTKYATNSSRRVRSGSDGRKSDLAVRSVQLSKKRNNITKDSMDDN